MPIILLIYVHVFIYFTMPKVCVEYNFYLHNCIHFYNQKQHCVHRSPAAQSANICMMYYNDKEEVHKAILSFLHFLSFWEIDIEWWFVNDIFTIQFCYIVKSSIKHENVNVTDTCCILTSYTYCCCLKCFVEIHIFL